MGALSGVCEVRLSDLGRGDHISSDASLHGGLHWGAAVHGPGAGRGPYSCVKQCAAAAELKLHSDERRPLIGGAQRY